MRIIRNLLISCNKDIYLLVWNVSESPVLSFEYTLFINYSIFEKERAGLFLMQHKIE